MRRKGGGKGSFSASPLLAPKPDGFDEAVKALRAKFPGVNVGYGFGAGAGLKAVDVKKDEEGAKSKGQWQLYVYTDDAELKVPVEFKGFPVFVRKVPPPVLPQLRKPRLS